MTKLRFLFLRLCRGKRPLFFSRSGVLLKSPMPEREGGSSLFKRETEQLCSKQPRRRIGGGERSVSRDATATRRERRLFQKKPPQAQGSRLPGISWRCALRKNVRAPDAGRSCVSRVQADRACAACTPISIMTKLRFFVFAPLSRRIVRAQGARTISSRREGRACLECRPTPATLPPVRVR